MNKSKKSNIEEKSEVAHIPKATLGKKRKTPLGGQSNKRNIPGGKRESVHSFLKSPQKSLITYREI